MCSTSGLGGPLKSRCLSSKKCSLPTPQNKLYQHACCIDSSVTCYRDRQTFAAASKGMIVSCAVQLYGITVPPPTRSVLTVQCKQPQLDEFFNQSPNCFFLGRNSGQEGLSPRQTSVLLHMQLLAPVCLFICCPFIKLAQTVIALSFVILCSFCCSTACCLSQLGSCC